MSATKTSPAEIDQQLASLYYAGQQLQQKRASALSTALRMAGAKYYYRGRQRVTDMTEEQAVEILCADLDKRNVSYGKTNAEAISAIVAIDLAINENDEAACALEASYTGWSRFFVVTSSLGHIHSSMSCSTCRPSTTYGWLPWLSGATEADAVAQCGENLCTVCFPSAPSDWVGGKLTAKQAEDILAGKPYQSAEAARQAKAAEKAEKAAAKLAARLPRDHALANKVDEIYEAFGDDVSAAYHATAYSSKRFAKGYATAFNVYSDVIEGRR